MANLDDFDEVAYLSANPDVAFAVATGSIGSGKAHYALYGAREHRPLNRNAQTEPKRFPIENIDHWSRRDKLLANLDIKNSFGLEIDALSGPLVRRDEGSIMFVDHATTDEFKRKHANEAMVASDDIVTVDAVWGAQSLQECVGPEKIFDYVIASHVVEHVPDIITWLSEVRQILKPTGFLRLAVPDKRFTFDYLRHVSLFHDAVDAYLHKARTPLPRIVFEHFYYNRAVNCAKAWEGAIKRENLVPTYSTEFALNTARSAFDPGLYHDSHCWVFTPESFIRLCIDLVDVGLLQFSCDFLFDTPAKNFEFYVSLRPESDLAKSKASWVSALEMLLSKNNL